MVYRARLEQRHEQQIGTTATGNSVPPQSNAQGELHPAINRPQVKGNTNFLLPEPDAVNGSIQNRAQAWGGLLQSTVSAPSSAVPWDLLRPLKFD